MKDVVLLKKEVKRYVDVADEKLVKMLHAMLQINAEKDWWDEASKETKISIEKGLHDTKAGKVTLHKDVMKKYKKWL
jgi:predicted transcriptional regulator